MPLGRTRRVALGTATTSDPFVSPSLSSHLRAGTGGEAARVCERCTQPTPKRCLVLPGQGVVMPPGSSR